MIPGGAGIRGVGVAMALAIAIVATATWFWWAGAPGERVAVGQTETLTPDVDYRTAPRRSAITTH